MRICKIYAGEFPWDVRVEKISQTLLEHGHDVTLVCRSSNNRPENEKYSGLTIHRFPLAKSLGIPRLLGDIPAFLNTRWTRFIDRIIDQHKCELILIRDLPLALNAISVARRHRIPIVLDMAENYPALFKDVLRFERHKTINFLVKNPVAAKVIERFVIRQVDSILLVIEESKERLIRLGASPEKIVVVSNTPRLTSPDANPTQSTKVDELRLIYVGGFERARGLEWFIRMFPFCLKAIPELHLYVLGDGPERPRLEGLSVDCCVRGKTHFLGWIEPRQVISYISRCDIGLVPHIVTEHINSTVPNKLFDYMLAGKPVLASDARPLQRILREEHCGVTFHNGDVGSLVGAITILKDPEVRKRLGDNGRAAVFRKYNWAMDGERLIDAIRCVARQPNRLQERHWNSL